MSKVAREFNRFSMYKNSYYETNFFHRRFNRVLTTKLIHAIGNIVDFYIKHSVQFLSNFALKFQILSCISINFDGQKLCNNIEKYRRFFY